MNDMSRLQHRSSGSGRHRPGILPLLLLLAALGALVLVCLPASASAQTREEAAIEIEKTDEVLAKAQDLLDETGAPRGRGTLELAVRLQTQAKVFFTSGNYRMAVRLTKEARDRALDALAGVRRAEDNEEAVERELECTDQILEQARDQDGGGLLAIRRLEQALSTQARAWEMFRNRRLRPALKLTLEARDAAGRLALRGRFGPGGPNLDSRVERQLDRLGQAIDRVADRIAPDNEQGQTELNSARSAYGAAQTAFNEGKFLLADQNLRLTRQALMRAVQTVEADLDDQDIAALINDARRRWENLGEDIDAGGEARWRDWHAKAGNDLNEAERALRSGDLRKAVVQTRAAMSMMDRIADELTP
ncbi:MAG TPA: hypothetical protein VNN55_05025 [bacterium]|nr:hypothetical protein [bacterium]